MVAIERDDPNVPPNVQIRSEVPTKEGDTRGRVWFRQFRNGVLWRRGRKSKSWTEVTEEYTAIAHYHIIR